MKYFQRSNYMNVVLGAISSAATSVMSMAQSRPNVSSGAAILAVAAAPIAPYVGVLAPVIKVALITVILTLINGFRLIVAVPAAIALVIALNIGSMILNGDSMIPPLTAFSAAVPTTSSSAHGPDGQAPKSSSVIEWIVNGGRNLLSLRGYDYASNDHVNHLPGGHGDMAQNAAHLEATQDLAGYDGPDFATIGTDHSQL